MDKPAPKTRVAYDFNDCTDYIEAKYGIEIRDFKQKHDFWRFLLDRRDLHRGCYFHLDRELLSEDTPDWAAAVGELYLKEFAADGKSIHFWVDW